jgi:shikimate kinase/3-dehydroquinate synthase
MSDPFRRIFLTGFSGTGKSSVARIVASALGWPAIDTDRLIEEAAGKPVADIFAADGEERFRALERDAVARAAAQDGAVIATGGGAVLAIENRRAMAEGGFVVCLDARPTTVLERLQAPADTDVSERPLLVSDDPLTRIVELRSQRQRYYALADEVIDTEKRRPEEVAEAVIAAAGTADVWHVQHPDRLLLLEERPAPPPAGPVWVEAPSRRYPVHVGWGILGQLGSLLRERGLSGAAHVISDINALPRHGEAALYSLRAAGFEAGSFAVAGGERSKTLETASRVFDWLVSAKAERGHTVVALGGGVVGDLAGFVAATYMRGLPFVQAPTSLLAMVDASVGGKVAVDHRAAKNLIGTFYQPWLVVADVSTLKTLPRAQLIDGCAEAIKHGLILDAGLLDDLERHADDLLHIEPAVTVDIVRRNVAVKASVVAEDERDSGRRALLNYGHTVAHGIEAAAGYAAGHGAADAIGMTAAARIGLRLGVTPRAAADRQRAVLDRFGLPSSASAAGLRVDADAVLAAMALDKKIAAGKQRWVLLEDAGRAALHSDVPEALVREVLTEVLR